MSADQFGNGENAIAAGHRDDDHLGVGSTRRIEDVEPAAVAVEHLYTEALDQFDLRRIVVDQRHGIALRAQQPGDDLAEAAIAEDNHLAALGQAFRNLGHRNAAVDRGDDKTVKDQQQHRGQRHREGDHDGP